MHYYYNAEDYISHHGILGQKWGKRNGPPYPLGQEAHSREEKDKAEDTERKWNAVNDLYKELDTEWDYGVLDKERGRIIEEDGGEGLSKYEWGKYYHTIPLDVLKKEKIGVCWDFVNYQHDRLKKAGIKDSAYLIIVDLRTPEYPERVVTHTFSTFELGSKEYWLESAAWPKRGIHEIKDFKEAAKEVKEIYTKEKVPYSLFKYNPDGLDKGLTDTEFFDKATEDNWIMDVDTDDEEKK